MAVFKRSEGESEGTSYMGTPANTGTGTDPQEPGTQQSYIGKTLFVKGNIDSDEDVLVEGKVEGTLSVKNRVVVGKSGAVKADIDARHILIKGTVNGNVKASYKVEIVPDGTLNGNITAQRVVLAEGALFKGSVDMNI